MADSLPIIKLEVMGMKHAIAHALSDYQAQTDADIQKAVADFCDAGNVTRIVREQVHECMQREIKKAVEEFYGYSGEGRKIIHDIVRARLAEENGLND